jgi:hypothetical protein
VDAGDGHLRENGGDTPLWGRQAGESDKAFHAFCAYRDLGPLRSLANAGQVLGKAKATLEQWSAKWAWVRRCSAWDDESDRLGRERDSFERREARRTMLDAHARHGAALHEVGATVLGLYDISDPETADVARARIAKMSALDGARLMVLGAEMERRSRGADGVDDVEAKRFAESLVDLCLAHLPSQSHPAFLSDVEARLSAG